MKKKLISGVELASATLFMRKKNVDLIRIRRSKTILVVETHTDLLIQNRNEKLHLVKITRCRCVQLKMPFGCILCYYFIFSLVKS